jgi:hypothetical protein
MNMLCCCLSVWGVQANAEQLQLVLGSEPGSCLKLEASAAYQMPLDDAVGPLHLTPVSEYDSARSFNHRDTVLGEFCWPGWALSLAGVQQQQPTCAWHDCVCYRGVC